MPRLAGPLLAGLLVASLATGSGGRRRRPAADTDRSFIVGTVTDAATGKPLHEVVVTLLSASLPEEKTVVTDREGRYRVDVPEGVFTLRLEIKDHRPYSRGGVQVRTGTTVRINVQLLPEEWEDDGEFIGCRLSPIDFGLDRDGCLGRLRLLDPRAAVRAALKPAGAFVKKP